MANPPQKPDAMQPDMRQGLFAPHTSLGKPSGDLAEQMMSSIRRLRILEERVQLLHRKTQVLEQNMLSSQRRVEIDIKKLQDSISEMRADVVDVKSTIKLVVSELSQGAKRQDVETLKKYITLWEPLNFVTRNEVRKLVGEALDEIEEQKQQ